MNAVTRMWLIGLAAAIAGAAIGAGATWSVQNGRIKDLEAKSEALESKLPEAEEVPAVEVTVPESQTATAAVAPSVAPKPPASPVKPKPNTAEDGRHFCYIKSATWPGATPNLTVDYAELLTGAAAASAAAAAGEESPPPNDYFIRNQNPKLRTFPASSSTKVKMLTKADGLVMEGYAMTFSQWFHAYNGGAGSFPGIKKLAYYITVKNGTVIRIEEPYFP